jgi:hypothetical protein
MIKETIESLTPIAEFIAKVGWPIIVGGYFMLRDWKYQPQIVARFDAMTDAINKLTQAVLNHEEKP